MKAVFAVFLCACAWKDLKEKEIPLIFLWSLQRQELYGRQEISGQGDGKRENRCLESCSVRRLHFFQGQVF